MRARDSGVACVSAPHDDADADDADDARAPPASATTTTRASRALVRVLARDGARVRARERGARDSREVRADSTYTRRVPNGAARA